jgi:alpha-D-xyloside xylohydrolase
MVTPDVDAQALVVQACRRGLETRRVVRAGSIVSLCPVVQYVDEQPGVPYEIRIYPGADGRFTLYDDDGQTYRYEQGEYATVALAWDDAQRRLRIGARDGGFPGMTGQRRLKVRLMPAHSGGRVQTKTVRFDGEAVEVQFKP